MKHNKIIDDLFEKLSECKSLEDILEKETEYDIKIKHELKHGEVDLLYLKTDYNKAYLFEVKTTDTYKSRQKALHQLYKDIKYIKQNYHFNGDVFLFYVHSKKHYKNKYKIEFIEKIKRK